MSKARLVITAVTVENRPVSEVARSCGVARSWIYTLLVRYRGEGEAAFEPRSPRPKTSPNAIGDATAGLIIELRKDLAGQGLDAGPDTIAWHLARHHQVKVSAATVARYLAQAGLVSWSRRSGVASGSAVSRAAISAATLSLLPANPLGARPSVAVLRDPGGLRTRRRAAP